LRRGSSAVSATSLVPARPDVAGAGSRATRARSGGPPGVPPRPGWHDAGVSEPGAVIRVALADDADLLREAIAGSPAAARVEVVGGAGDVPGLLDLVERTDPDVVIVDVRMPPTHTTEGLEAATTIRRRRPSTAILVLSQYVETRYAVELVREDARGLGYLLKD